MANNNFVVKNGLTVNGSFTANSTVVTAAAINATSVNTATANATTSIVVGSAVSINTTSFVAGAFIANSTVVNAAAVTATSVNSASVSLAGVNITGIITGNAATAYSNGVTYTNTLAGTAYANAVANAAAVYQTTAGLTANVVTRTANNTLFVGSTSAANVVSNTQLSSNLANYQTTAGLSANVQNLTANNASYLNGQPNTYYTNIPARLGYTPINKTGDGMTGDLTVTRTDTGFANRGAIFLGNSGVRFIYYNGTNYEIPGGKVIASNFMVDTNQSYYMTADEAVYMRWDGSFTAFSHRLYTPGTINAGGTIATSGRVYCKSPDNVADGYAMINSQGRFRDWIWDDAGGFVSFAIDGNPKGITVFDSDISLKKDIKPTTYDATKTINDIEFVSYNWKPTQYTDKDGVTHTTNKGHVECGFVAQQLEQVDPGLVKMLSDGKLMPDMLNLTSVLGLALQTAQKKIDVLEQRLAALESKVG